MRKLKKLLHTFMRCHKPLASGPQKYHQLQLQLLVLLLQPKRTTLITAKVFTTLESVSAAERHFAVELSALELCSRGRAGALKTNHKTTHSADSPTFSGPKL